MKEIYSTNSLEDFKEIALAFIDGKDIEVLIMYEWVVVRKDIIPFNFQLYKYRVSPVKE